MSKKDIIENLLEGTIQYCVRTKESCPKHGLNIYCPELFNRLSEYFACNGNNHFFQIKGLTIDKLMKYTDGTYSSIIKGATRIEGKQGYELLNPIDLVYDIFNIVKNWFGKELAQLFDNRINTNANQINNLLNILEIQKYSKLKTYGTFLKEVYEEVDVATKYPKHSLITANNLQKIRIELVTIFNTNVEEIRMNLNSQKINFDKLFNDYINLRYITEYLIIALILEYILSDRIDDRSIERLKIKIDNIQNDYKDINTLIYANANSRSENQENNQFIIKNRWKFCFEQLISDNNIAGEINIEIKNLKKFLMNIDDNETDDVIFMIVDKFLSKRKKMLDNVKIIPKLIEKK